MCGFRMGAVTDWLIWQLSLHLKHGIEVLLQLEEIAV
jgi:hypothetical protein